jgi:hypothetical protein
VTPFASSTAKDSPLLRYAAYGACISPNAASPIGCAPLTGGSPPWPTIDVDKAIPWVETRTGKTFAASQRAAIGMVLNSKAAVVTGGPGVGKTTLLDAILRIPNCEAVGFVVSLPLSARWNPTPLDSIPSYANL